MLGGVPMEASGGRVMRLVSSGNDGEEKSLLNHYRGSTTALDVQLGELL